MLLSEIQSISDTQKLKLEKQELGLGRQILSGLPNIQSHALVISGIRRCGKSTLLRQFVQNLNKPYFYFNFDDIRLVSFSKADFGLLDKVISDTNAKLLYFDEIQSAQYWELYVRQKLDEGFQVFITGSNASLLSRELGTYLTGRHITHELFPFSYNEFIRFFSLEPGCESLSNYLEKGGFPEFLKTDNTSILTQLQSDILHRDIMIRYRIRDAASLQRLFVYLVSNASQLLSPSKLTRMVNVKSPTTVLEYISYLEAAYLVNFLPCFSWSVKSQNLSPKKAYIADTGIIKSLSFSFSENLGAILENFVFNSLRLTTPSSDMFYFKGKNGGECDFVLSPQTNPKCIQVTWELNTNNQDREINGMLEALDFFNLDYGVIVTYDTEDIILTAGKKIDVIPAWKYACTSYKE